jgi:hypothetical protein
MYKSARLMALLFDAVLPLAQITAAIKNTAHGSSPKTATLREWSKEFLAIHPSSRHHRFALQVSCRILTSNILSSHF